jgi:hypothetical protein
MDHWTSSAQRLHHCRRLGITLSRPLLRSYSFPVLLISKTVDHTTVGSFRFPVRKLSSYDLEVAAKLPLPGCGDEPHQFHFHLISPSNGSLGPAEAGGTRWGCDTFHRYEVLRGCVGSLHCEHYILKRSCWEERPAHLAQYGCPERPGG